MSSMTSRNPSSMKRRNDATWMSIKFGTSMTRRRRAYDRRCSGARDGAMAATTAIPPRRDRKRTATRARASAGMQMRGANVQHSNAQGHSATGGCTTSAAGLSGGPRRYQLVPVRASRLWITSLFTWRTCPRADEPCAARARSLLNAAFTPAAANWREHDATVQRGTTRRYWGSRGARRLLRMEQPMEQPTTPAEPAPEQRNESSDV